MNTWVIPDIHGCLITFRHMVEKEINLQKNDQLFILGDFIDRGPDSKGVIDYIMKLEKRGFMVTTIKGNHEDYMLKAIEEDKKPGFFDRLMGKNRTHKEWFRFGGEETVKSFEVTRPGEIPMQYVDWLSNLPVYSSWQNYLIVHAGFNFKNDNIFEDEHAMMWIKDFDIDPEKLNGKKIVHGHVPVELEFIFTCVGSSHFNFIALDNGVYMSNRPGYGNLTALELNKMDLKVIPNMDF